MKQCLLASLQAILRSRSSSHRILWIKVNPLNIEGEKRWNCITDPFGKQMGLFVYIEKKERKIRVHGCIKPSVSLVSSKAIAHLIVVKTLSWTSVEKLSSLGGNFGVKLFIFCCFNVHLVFKYLSNRKFDHILLLPSGFKTNPIRCYVFDYMRHMKMWDTTMIVLTKISCLRLNRISKNWSI